MKRFLLISLILFIPLVNTIAQKERKMVREGVKNYNNEKFSEAEVQFRKALDKKPDLYEADYNIANSLYKQKKYEEAAHEYDQLIQRSDNPESRADLYHNLGNANLMAQQYDKSIDAYKNSLRIRPGDEDTRYNLAYAQAKLKEQQQQKQNDKNKDKENKDQDKDKQNQDQQNKDQQDKQQEKQKDEKQQQQDQQEKKDDKKDEQQMSPEEKISKQEAKQMLNAVQNQEKEVKEKVDKKKVVARPLKTEKDW